MKKHVLAALAGVTVLAGGLSVAAAAQTNQTASPDGNGAVSRPPMRGMRAGELMRADANGDGVVTRDEVIADADRRFTALDADGDAKLSRDEVRSAWPDRRRDSQRVGPVSPDRPVSGSAGGEPARPPMTREAFRERALKRFDRADTNHDGRVDAQEINAMRLLRRARMADGGHQREPSSSVEQQ